MFYAAEVGGCVVTQMSLLLLFQANASQLLSVLEIYRVVQKTDTKFYFWDNLGNSAPILTILSLLQAEIYGT